MINPSPLSCSILYAYLWGVGVSEFPVDFLLQPFSWIIKSLYSGKLLPFTEEKNTLSLPFVNVKVSEVPSSSDMSEEI